MLNSDTEVDSEVLQAALNCLPDPVLIVNASLHIVFANRAAVRLCGIDLAGQLVVAALRHPDALDCLTEAAESRSKTKTRIILSENGIESRFKLSAAPISGNGRTENALAVMLRDDSDSDGAGQMRRSFIANVSHELRSPLTALTSCAETLRNTPPEDKEARSAFLDIIEQETKRMNRLVSDLLSLSKLEANERVRPTTPVNIHEILEASVRLLRSTADSRKSTLRLNSGDDGLHVLGDPDQLSQVFLNLIENSLKYGCHGGCVEVTYRREPQFPGIQENAVTVEVSDDGPGIDPVHLPRLTERFYRVDDHRSQKVGGTGLGLAIVKHIVQRHRGRLSITSEPGKGSVFRVTLPASAS